MSRTFGDDQLFRPLKLVAVDGSHPGRLWIPVSRYFDQFHQSFVAAVLWLPSRT